MHWFSCLPHRPYNQRAFRIRYFFYSSGFDHRNQKRIRICRHYKSISFNTFKSQKPVFWCSLVRNLLAFFYINCIILACFLFSFDFQKLEQDLELNIIHTYPVNIYIHHCFSFIINLKMILILNISEFRIRIRFFINDGCGS